MRAVTGIELGVDSCVMARVRPGRETVRVSALHGLFEDDWNRELTRAENLREARGAKRFPRRAQVVAWGIHEGASLQDVSAAAALAPLSDAGFVVDAVMSPPEALALLARHRPRPAGRSAAAWLAINRRGTAMAVVDGGELLYARAFEWNYRPATTVKEELLQRYSLVAHLAPELRHAIDVVRAKHGVRVDAVVTCGDLPDLRSLTMPLIEELDIEVETLDTLDGLEVVPPADVEAAIERAPAMRLACTAALAKPVVRTSPARRWMGAAAVVLMVLLAWAAAQYVGRRRADDRRAAGRQPDVQPTVGVSRTPQLPATQQATDRGIGGSRDGESAASGDRGSGGPGSRGTQTPESTGARAVANDRPISTPNVPAATTGRQDPPAAAARNRRAAARSEPVPLSAPLPVVNSILVAPDRRLAVVDGEIVREGDRVGPRVLMRIESGALLFREPSGYELRVPIRRRLATQVERESGR